MKKLSSAFLVFMLIFSTVSTAAAHGLSLEELQRIAEESQGAIVDNDDAHDHNDDGQIDNIEDENKDLTQQGVSENFEPSKPVITEEDLLQYAQAIEAMDDNIKEITVNNEIIRISYLQPAKLFGLIPVNLPVSAEINTQGGISVNFPWYSVLTKHTLGDLKNRLEDSFKTSGLKFQNISQIQQTLQIAGNVMKSFRENLNSEMGSE